MNRRARKRLAIATVVLIAAFAVAVVWIVRSQGAYYRQVGDLNGAMDGKTVKVGGTVLAGTVSQRSGACAFHLVDMTGNDATVSVDYTGKVPDTFAPGVDVVIIGTYHSGDNLIEAEELQTKCPSKYEASRSPAP